MMTLHSRTAKTLINSLFMIATTYLIGCEQPDYRIRDNIGVEVSLFSNPATLLSARYLTNSTVTFSVTRSEGGGAEGLEIKVSEPSLLKRISEENVINLDPVAFEEECVGDNCNTPIEQEVEEGLRQSYAVQGAGAVTLTFLDDGKEIASERIELFDASRVTTSVKGLTEEEGAEQALHIAVGGRYQVQVDAYVDVNGEEQAIAVGGLVEAPRVEGEVGLSRTPWTRRLAFNFEPTQAGDQLVALKLGGHDVRVDLQAVELDVISELKVSHEQHSSSTSVDDQGEETTIELYQSSLSVFDASETEILGAKATWTALDAPEIAPITSSRLVYEHSERESVTFEVRVGDLVKEVTLPMNPQSSILYGEELEGCDQANASAVPSLLIMMLCATYVARRRLTA